MKPPVKQQNAKQTDPIKGLLNALKAAKVAQLAEKVAEVGQ